MGFDGLRPFTGTAKKLVLHRTQGLGFPNWTLLARGIPHFTADFDTGEVRQHLPLNIAAYTLKGGDHSPNSEAGLSIQVEIVGLSEDSPNQSPQWYANLKAFIEWHRDNLGIPVTFPFPFVASSTSARQSWETYRDASGIVGHQHAPYNDHWDPGAVRTDLLRPAEPPAPPEPPAPQDGYVTRSELAAALRALASNLDTE